MANRIRAPRAAVGMTLVELMVTVGIVGILAAIAYPSYQRYVARTHRNAASACLSQYAQFMERYYTANLTYVDAEPVLPCRQENSLDDRYEITLRDDSATANEYILDATPVGVQATIDAECGTLTLNQIGARTVSGDAGTATCWR
jgi:type IV pilus assembly protein PilE